MSLSKALAPAAVPVTFYIDPPYDLPAKIKEDVYCLWGKLSLEQQEALYPLITRTPGGIPGLYGQSVFITGSAGTGKSYFVGVVKSLLKKIYPNMAITGTTGASAWNIADENFVATTLQSLIPNGATVDDVMPTMLKDQESKARMIRDLDLLIIDEVSMMSARYFTVVNQVCQRCRSCNLPMGGLVVVMLGDMKQLPPVPDRGDAADCDSRRYIYEAELLMEAVFGDRVYEFKQNHRQGEGDWSKTLERIGYGRPSAADIACLRRRVKEPPKDAMRLYPTNKSVDNFNHMKMNELRSEMFTIERSSGYTFAPNLDPSKFARARQRLDALVQTMFMANEIPAFVTLKAGAHIMITRNIDVPRGLCNGATFVFIHYDKASRLIRAVRMEDKDRIDDKSCHVFIPPRKWTDKLGWAGVATVEMHPVAPCWAMTIHKVQGLTISTPGAIDLSSAFAAGQTYTALSRFRTLENVYLLDFNRDVIITSDTLAMFVALLSKKKDARDLCRPPMSAEVAQERLTVMREWHEASLLVAAGCFDEDAEEGSSGGDSSTTSIVAYVPPEDTPEEELEALVACGAFDGDMATQASADGGVGARAASILLSISQPTRKSSQVVRGKTTPDDMLCAGISRSQSEVSLRAVAGSQATDEEEEKEEEGEEEEEEEEVESGTTERESEGEPDSSDEWCWLQAEKHDAGEAPVSKRSRVINNSSPDLFE